jgi:hypothetical protein
MSLLRPIKLHQNPTFLHRLSEADIRLHAHRELLSGWSLYSVLMSSRFTDGLGSAGCTGKQTSLSNTSVCWRHLAMSMEGSTVQPETCTMSRSTQAAIKMNDSRGDVDDQEEISRETKVQKLVEDAADDSAGNMSVWSATPALAAHAEFLRQQRPPDCRTTRRRYAQPR